MLHYPWPVFVYPTRRCNYRCSYCFTDSAPERAAAGPLLAHWDRFCQEAAALKIPEIRISGGEPLLMPQLEWMCRAIVSRGMRYTITTNGSLLQRHLSWLCEIPPETLWISFHREYRSAAEFRQTVEEAVVALPRVGLNVFAPDWDESFGAAGVARLKLLSQSPVGRSDMTGHDRSGAPVLSDAIEVRIEKPDDHPGRESCVLLDRPLLSFDVDARAYACCVTVGESEAEIGDFRIEPLSAIAARTLAPLAELPCRRLLPDVAEGHAGCPVRLHST